MAVLSSHLHSVCPVLGGRDCDCSDAIVPGGLVASAGWQLCRRVNHSATLPGQCRASDDAHWDSGMSVVEIPVSERKLAARLVLMRTWLYKRRCSPVRFETQPEEGGIVLVSVRFDTLAMAEEFRRRFVPGAGDPLTPTDAPV